MAELHEFRPDYAVHPGEVIREMRQTAGLRQSHLAGMCRVSPKHMCQIELGHKPLHAELAVAIELALGVSTAQLLMRMQADYDVHAARAAARLRAETELEALRKIGVGDD